MVLVLVLSPALEPCLSRTLSSKSPHLVLRLLSVAPILVSLQYRFLYSTDVEGTQRKQHIEYRSAFETYILAWLESLLYRYRSSRQKVAGLMSKTTKKIRVYDQNQDQDNGHKNYRARITTSHNSAMPTKTYSQKLRNVGSKLL